MLVAFERVQQSLDTLVTEHSDGVIDLNEATTRLRMIDRLLIGYLGWAPEQINAEEYQLGDYIDYMLGQPERMAVVEAKRPVGTSSCRPVLRVRSRSGCEQFMSTPPLTRKLLNK